MFSVLIPVLAVTSTLEVTATTGDNTLNVTSVDIMPHAVAYRFFLQRGNGGTVSGL